MQVPFQACPKFYQMIKHDYGATGPDQCSRQKLYDSGNVVKDPLAICDVMNDWISVMQLKRKKSSVSFDKLMYVYNWRNVSK